MGNMRSRVLADLRSKGWRGRGGFRGSMSLGLGRLVRVTVRKVRYDYYGRLYRAGIAWRCRGRSGYSKFTSTSFNIALSDVHCFLTSQMKSNLIIARLNTSLFRLYSGKCITRPRVDTQAASAKHT